MPGYWNFTTGLRMDYELTKDPASRQAVILLSNAAMYAADSVPIAWLTDIERSREVAYALLAHQDAEALGAPPRPRRSQLRDIVYGHFAQWFGDATYLGSGKQFSPFIVALSAHSLIRDWEETRDPRCLPTLRQAADWLWSHAWDPKVGGMAYDINGIDGPTKGAVDLNLLIAPMYAFLYAETGDPNHRDRADELFSTGVHKALPRWRQAVQPELLVELRLRPMADARPTLSQPPCRFTSEMRHACQLRPRLPADALVDAPFAVRTVATGVRDGTLGYLKTG